MLARGITHIVEHLAMHALRDKEHAFNASVDGSTLTFWASGSEQQVVDFFDDLARQLRSLPVDRLETEAGVLAAEAEGREVRFCDHLLSVFFGPNGPGLDAYPERGFALVGPREVQQWADRHCVLQNAVLMITAPPPTGLRVDLPVGEHRPFALPDGRFGYRPERLEQVTDEGKGISLGTLAQRSTDIRLAWQLFSRRLTDRLRHELGLVYQAWTAYLPLAGDTAFLYAGVDALEGQLEKTVFEFMAVMDELRNKDPKQDELSSLQRLSRNLMKENELAMAQAELQRVGGDHLLRHPAHTWEQLMAEQASAKRETVGAAFRTATDRGIITAPAFSLGLPTAKEPDSEPLEGKRFRPRRRGAEVLERLIVGSEGLSGYCQGRWVSLRWKDIVLAERLAPTKWSLLSRDNAWMILDASDWWWRTRVALLLEDGIPQDVRLPQPRRG